MKIRKTILSLLLILCMVLPVFSMADGFGLDLEDSAKAALAEKLYANYAKDISGEIEFYQQKPECEEWYDEAIKLFSEFYPEIKVEQNVQSDASEVLRVRSVSGEFTDVWLYWPTDAIFASFQESGLIMDVTDEPFVQYSGSGAQALYEFDGKMYGVPIAMNCAGLVCNVGMFEALNIELPTTWEEFEAACEAFRAAGQDPLVITAKSGADCAIVMIYGNYITTDQVKQIAKGELKFSDIPEWRHAVEQVNEFYLYGQENAVSTDYNDGLTNFALEKGAMLASGNWILNSVAAINPDVRMALIPMPAGKGYVTSGIDVGLSIGAKTKYPEACKAFVNFLSCPEIAQIFCNYDSAVPAIKGVTIDDERVNHMVEAIAEGKSFNWPNHFYPAGGADSAFGEAGTALCLDHDVDAFIARIDEIMSGVK